MANIAGRGDLTTVGPVSGSSEGSLAEEIPKKVSVTLVVVVSREEIGPPAKEDTEKTHL